MIDVDGVEFDNFCHPIIFKELKHGNCKEVDLGSFEIKCLRNIADSLIKPLIVVLYYFYCKGRLLENNEFDMIDHIQYRIIPANKIAKRNLSFEQRGYTEEQYVEYLYKLRNDLMPKEIREQLYKEYRPTNTVDIKNKII